jgi:phosphoglycolate phosphatase-like HAD superfamily hydrolase
VDAATRDQLLALFAEGFSGKMKEKIPLKTRIFCAVIGQSKNLLIISLLLQIMEILHVPITKRPAGLQFSKTYFNDLFMKAPLFPGVADAIVTLHQRYNLKFGILTLGSREEFFSRFRQYEPFISQFEPHAVIGRNDVKALKPDPEGLIQLSQLWQVPLNQIWMVGDMDVDIRVAQKAGCISVGVLSGYLKTEQMGQLNPDLILNSVAELPQVLENLKKLNIC